MVQFCNHLENGEVCRHGCTRGNGTQQIMCHKFARGRCPHITNACKRGLHCKPKKTTSTQPRGDGFRPYTADTTAEKILKQHLATLGLSPFCENLLDLDADLLETLYRKLAKYRHPDKSPNGASSERFIQLQIAKEHIKQRLPFRTAT